MAKLDVKTQCRLNMKDREDLRSVEHAKDYIEIALSRVGATGNWLARATQKITMNDRRFKVKSMNEVRRAIQVKVRPGDNGSAWEYDLCAPNGIEFQELTRVYQQLRTVHIDDKIEHRPVRPPILEEPLPELAQHKTFIPVDDGSPVLRPCSHCNKLVDVGFKNRHFEYAEARRFCTCLTEKPPMTIVQGPDGVFHKGTVAQIAHEPAPAMSDDKLIGIMSRLGTIVQRVAKRKDQKQQLLAQKQSLEEAFEDITKEMNEVDECLRGIAKEEAEDMEAEAAKGIMALMEGKL